MLFFVNSNLGGLTSWSASAGALFFGDSQQKLIFITGAGSTFVNPIFSKWFYEYNKLHPLIEINYQGIGSGGGVKQLQKNTVQFAATDFPVKPLVNGKRLLHFPVALGAIVLSYNLPGLKLKKAGANDLLAKYSLKLDSRAVVLIAQGKAQFWDDSYIQSLNPHLEIPHTRILFIYRSDASGSTGIFSEYLGLNEPDFRTEIGVGKALKWPSGIGGKGNEGVMANVKNTPGAIGYVEFSYAYNEHLNMVELKNLSGKFIAPTLKSIALAGVNNGAASSKDFTQSLLNPPNPDAYPISSYSYFVAYENTPAPYGKELARLLRWMLTEGQGYTEKLGYAPLPKELIKKMLPTVGAVEGTDDSTETN